MERLPQQSIPWRAFAVLVFLLLFLMSLSRTSSSAIGFNWYTARGLYWSISVAALLGYAFGFRILSVTFWRVYAILFTAEIGLRSLRLAWRGSSGEAAHSTAMLVLFLAMITLTCVALLRYADLLGGGNKSFNPWPPRPKDVSSEPKLDLRRAGLLIVGPYSLLHCLIAAVAGAAVNVLFLVLYGGEINSLALLTIFSVIGFAVLALAGRPLVRRLAPRGRDTPLRGLMWGGLAGSAVGAVLGCLFFAAVGGPLNAWPAYLLAAFLGMIFGVFDGAAAGITFVLLAERANGDRSHVG